MSETIEKLAEEIRAEFDSSTRRYNFLFAENVKDFVAIARRLQTLGGDPDEMSVAARRLCELSREINFTAPDAEHLPPAFKRNLRRLFRQSADLIPRDDEPFAAYKHNIRERVKDITGPIAVGRVLQRA